VVGRGSKEFVEDRDRIHSEIDFFGRPDEHGPAVAAWLRSVNLAMFEPMVNRLQRAIGPPVEIEPHDFYREGTWYVQLSTATLRGSLSFYRYSPENLQKVIRKLGDGRLARVRLSVLEMMGGPGEAETLNVEVWFDSVEFPDWANSVLVQGPTSWIERFMGRVERPVVDLAKLAARELRAATGYVTLGGGSKVESSYEKAAGVGFADGLRFARENVRGAYWGTVLSKWHVEALGGVERIQSTAPCAVVEVLASAPSPLLWLQATIDFASFGHPQQLALRDYLGPVLPKRRPLPTGASARAWKRPRRGPRSPHPFHRRSRRTSRSPGDRSGTHRRVRSRGPVHAPLLPAAHRSGAGGPRKYGARVVRRVVGSGHGRGELHVGGRLR